MMRMNQVTTTGISGKIKLISDNCTVKM